MPLSIATLSQDISNNILQQSYTPLPVNGVPQPPVLFSGLLKDTVWLNSFCTAIAAAVVNHIQLNAVTTVTVAEHTHTGGTLLGGFTGTPVPGPTAVETGDHSVSTGGVE
jgi:hypothetical protein